MDNKHPTVDGFYFAATSCGIKPNGALDLGLIASEEAVATAGVFTKNRVRAAPVLVSSQRIERGRNRAILVNSGNANACTGKEGIEAVRHTTGAVADAMGEQDEMILAASTGVIGVPLAVAPIEQAVPGLIDRLSPEGFGEFAQAIMTTDRWPKIASTQITIGGQHTVTLLGIAKGAGMIHPQLATTLAFVVTDAPMHSSFLQRALRSAADATFNRINVDGDTSTNDTIFAMASGKVKSEPLRGSDRDARGFIDAMKQVLGELGESIVKDGEGARHLVRIEVTSAPSEAAAHNVARAIATSTLVQTALHGQDANWGRILAAAGNAGVAFDGSRIGIKFDHVTVVKKGIGLGPGAERDAKQVMANEAYTIGVDLDMGSASSHYLTCDIGHSYVDINASYRS